MSEIPVKVKIWERIYPLRVNALHEENVRKAAGMINDRIHALTDTHPAADKQDVLAMCAIELGSELLQTRLGQLQQNEMLGNRLAGIENVLLS